MFQEDKLTLTKAIELAQNLETASMDAQTKARPNREQPGAQGGIPVSSGLTNNKANDRRLKETTCHGCGKKGHIKRACKSSRQPQRRGRKTPMPRQIEVTKINDHSDQSDKDSDGSVEVIAELYRFHRRDQVSG